MIIYNKGINNLERIADELFRSYPPIVIGRHAHLAGIIPEPTPTLPQDLLPFFTWQKVPKEDITITTA